MYMIASFDCKFKTNQQNIEKTLQHYGLRKIQSSLYAGDLNNDERQELTENISEIIRENDNVLIMPVCQSCYSKKENCGRKIKFKEELYKVF
ncbi:MAG: CRISPR-associated endonuclease Cas2 [Methanobrevibacter sp.]|uniref:CRISPR-associated endonuclease Cas2 n=1 Tax=Methanobrevibacter sp. TaxID=66852 RepID=UPI0025D2B056|nr:CRISPR-associated endonuclease Cas2 [Methanobrevibacter sp.]MBQ8017292.1 CRISPR-associated endonuclease Cas2 [Methanobrevibacter sp.]